jgi:AcrR family transcriptional regulator
MPLGNSSRRNAATIELQNFIPEHYSVSSPPRDDAHLDAVLLRAYPGARSNLKRRILACALDCFNEHGMEATSIDLIKLRAETSVGAIYHHFKSKEGVAAALYFLALDDQSRLFEARLGTADEVEKAIKTMVGSYLEWVVSQPELARFLLQARAYVARGPHANELAERNRGRFKPLIDWMILGTVAGRLRTLPRETYAPLLIGQAESYCRAWLSGRVKVAPTVHTEVFAEAAWRTLAV